MRKNAQMREIPHEDPEAETPEIIDVELEETPDETEEAIRDSELEQQLEAAADGLLEEPVSESDKDEASVEESVESEQELALEYADETPEPEPEKSLPEPIPVEILDAARSVMSTFTEVRPEGYVARLEASGSEWMTISDDSLSNDLERELLTSAAAMCLWGEQMICYQGESASAFTDAFGVIGPVFVRGQAGQWRIVSRLRAMVRRLRV